MWDEWMRPGYYGGWMDEARILFIPHSSSIHPPFIPSHEWVKVNPHSSPFPIHPPCPVICILLLCYIIEHNISLNSPLNCVVCLKTPGVEVTRHPVLPEASFKRALYFGIIHASMVECEIKLFCNTQQGNKIINVFCISCSLNREWSFLLKRTPFDSRPLAGIIF